MDLSRATAPFKKPACASSEGRDPCISLGYRSSFDQHVHARSLEFAIQTYVQSRPRTRISVEVDHVVNSACRSSYGDDHCRRAMGIGTVAPDDEDQCRLDSTHSVRDDTLNELDGGIGCCRKLLIWFVDCGAAG